MSKQTKKQSLLGQAQTKRPNKRTAKRNKPAQNVPQQTTTINVQQQPEIKRGKIKWIILALLLLLFIIFPKPKLLIYQKLGLVAESIYWDGLPGIEPLLLDSKLHPRSSLEQDILYLCTNKNDPKTCQRYHIIEQRGIISAAQKYLLD